MLEPVDIKILTCSQKIFERLLVAYPKAHREEYGHAMSQLFQDQSREAWNEARNWGMIKLWLRVLPDLMRTSIVERLSALNERKSMFDKIAALFRPRQTPFLAVFVSVFLLAFTASIVITFILPKSYGSTARIRVERVPINAIPGGRPNSLEAYDPYFLQTEFEVIQSTAVLGRVVEKLNLGVEWGKAYNGGMNMSASGAVEFLRRRITIRPVRNTQLVTITAYDWDPNEAARLANAITDAYRSYCRDLRKQAEEGKSPLLNANVTSMEVVGPAEPELVPVRPNKPLNIVIGALVGILLGSIIGGASAYVASLLRRNAQQKASPP
jgi:uncharacterized protein involved in exopolysaccharide biosynthesis